MDLKPGYKQTEVGVIPEDWELRCLLSTVRIANGQVDPRNEPFKSMILVAPDHIESGTGKLLDKRTAGEQRAISGKYLFDAGDVVYSKIRPYLRKAILADFNGLCSADMYPLKPESGVIGGFVLPILLAHRFTKYAESVSVRSGMPKINRDELAGFSYALPSEPEQQAIANALSDVDALLDGLDRLITKKRDLKQAAIQQLLTGETRLPGFVGEWKEKRLGDHVTFLRNGVNSRAELTTDDPVKYLHYGDIHASGQAFLTPQNLPSLPSDRARTLDRLQDGDLVFADASEDLDGVGKSIEIIDASNMACVAGLHTIAARFDKAVLADGFKGYLQFCSTFSRQLKRLAAGTKVYATNRAHIASIEMRLPEVDEQAAIATVLSDMDADIAALEQRRNKTKDLKQAMMQELLTGRIRLINPCESIEQAVSKSTDANPHSWAFNEAVVISTLAKHFGKEDFPLGRKRYTKLSYLLHRHAEKQAEGYLKKAAGPYNPKTKYGGPERIALGNGYIREHKNGRFSGFVAADNIAQAEEYFEKWYGPDAVRWLNQFRFKTNDDLEVLATVDMAAEELRTSGKIVDVTSVKEVIHSHPEWKAKLDREAFSDTNIANGIKQNHILFNSDTAGGLDV